VERVVELAVPNTKLVIRKYWISYAPYQGSEEVRKTIFC
jgi:hypothetical protein